MDANGSRFHLALTELDWLGVERNQSPPIPPAVKWHEMLAHLTLSQRVVVVEDGDGSLDPLRDRRGASPDRYGNWYWIDESCMSIRFRGRGFRHAEAFWPVEPLRCNTDSEVFRPAAAEVLESAVLAGLAVTRDHYLVAGLVDLGGLLVFDLHGGGPALRISWPNEVPFVPFDVAPTVDGGAVVLDREHRALWILDRWLRVEGDTPAGTSRSAPVFRASNGEPSIAPWCGEVGRITAAMAVDASSVDDAIAVEALPDGSLLVLDAPAAGPTSSVHWFRDRASRGVIQLVRAEGDNPPRSIPTPRRAYDMAFVPDDRDATDIAGVLYVVSSSGEQSFAHRLTRDDNTNTLKHEFLADHYPLHKFGGRALATSEGCAAYDSSDKARWIPLAREPRPLYLKQARIQLPPPSVGERIPNRDEWAYDGKEPGCVWHRVLIDACIPARSAVRLETRAADALTALPAEPWRPQPQPYDRGVGSELPYQKPDATEDTRARTWETLLQATEGRFLQIRVTLEGDGRTSPQIQAMRVYYPRFSYLREYLPAVFSDEPIAAGFLDRYLANPEGLFTTLEDRIARVEALFDLRTVPGQYLDWLASWFGMELDPTWNESRRRLLLMHAWRMFRERGTRAGLLRSIRLALDDCVDDSLFRDDVTQGPTPGFAVRIVEQFLTRRAPGVVYGDPTARVVPRAAPVDADWMPEEGAEPLHRRFRDYLEQRYGEVEGLNEAWGAVGFKDFFDPQIRFVGVEPAHPGRRRDWDAFRTEALGFTYERVERDDLGFYTEYLARRYRSAASLNTRYGGAGVAPLADLSRAEVEAKLWIPQLLCTLPNAGPPLRDWIEFVSAALVADRKAHRFVVLVPVDPSERPDEQQRKLDVARRVTELEKPAHTAFDVRLYWAAFRVGEARAGLETIVGKGSRSIALELGNAHLAGSHLPIQTPLNASPRWLAGGHAPTSPSWRN